MAVTRLSGAPIFIDDNPNVTVMDIRARARRLKKSEGDLGIVGREAFATPPGYSVHDHHLYVCAPDWGGHGDQVAFRDYLRTDPGAARAYARLKRSLAIKHRDNRAAYANAKAGFVAAVLKRAR